LKRKKIISKFNALKLKPKKNLIKSLGINKYREKSETRKKKFFSMSSQTYKSFGFLTKLMVRKKIGCL
jgi:hypothetical protein